jgi:hypothetical protein
MKWTRHRCQVVPASAVLIACLRPLVNADGDDRRVADHALVEAHLVVRRIDSQVTMLAHQRPRPKGGRHGVELAADARDLRLRAAVQAERPHQSSTWRVETPCT